MTGFNFIVSYAYFVDKCFVFRLIAIWSKILSDVYFDYKNSPNLLIKKIP